MSDLEGDFRISFHEPPPSPVSKISYSFQETQEDALPNTPKRKRRETKEISRPRKHPTKEKKSSSTKVAAVEQSQTSPEMHPFALHNTSLNTESTDPDSMAMDMGSLMVDESCFAFGDSETEVSITRCEFDSSGGSQAVNRSEEMYTLFIEAVFAEECAFWQLTPTLFIVNGWDSQARTASSLWYHLQQGTTSEGKSIRCLCPDARRARECFHEQFIKDYGDERFPPGRILTTRESGTFLFSRNPSDDDSEDRFYNLFSVPTNGRISTSKTRAVVEYMGDDTGSGTWRCFKDPSVKNCAHILSARNSLQQHIKRDASAKDPSAVGGAYMYEDPVIRQATEDYEPVSYRAIPPPLWARISGDPERPPIDLITEAPTNIPLTEFSTCSCKSDSNLRGSYDASQSVKILDCEIYGLTKMSTSKIQIQKCQLCKHRFIGPDCREMGLFNWNNRLLFTHDLLDDYTSSYTSSETPFVAWVSVVARWYSSHRSPKPFISHKKFRAVWFAYAKLMELNNDMCCPKCGPTPKVTIWDGVTLAFSRKNILPSLRPPTAFHPNAAVRADVRYPIKPQCIEDKTVRNRIRTILTGPALRSPSDAHSLSDEELESGSSDEDLSQDEEDLDDITSKAAKSAARANRSKRKADIAMCKRLKFIPSTIEAMVSIDPYLGALFKRCYGVEELRCPGRKVPEAYRELFLQLAAHESALQLMTRPVLNGMRKFNLGPSLETVRYLTMFPTLYNVVRLELMDPCGGPTTETLGLCQWLEFRGWTVFFSLRTHEDAEKDAKPADAVESWQKTGSCYSMPQIRHRPVYPGLPTDGQADAAVKEGKRDGCNKYYSDYGQKRLTGGLMIAWCTHSICYGFHCIPIAEGRNEVFSAIYTHWEKAPAVVVYDFACSLQPYCMTREPEFFADTAFLIDLFHCNGHTKCGKASFMGTYVDINPELMSVNTSAAECGNGGLRHIRKSVSYMTQEWAIIYTKVYLSLWNRARIQKMESLAA